MKRKKKHPYFGSCPGCLVNGKSPVDSPTPIPLRGREAEEAEAEAEEAEKQRTEIFSIVNLKKKVMADIRLCTCILHSNLKVRHQVISWQWQRGAHGLCSIH